MGWLPGWTYRKQINITGQAGAGTLYQIALSIDASVGGDLHLNGHCVNFPQDIQFTDNDGETLLDYWIEDLTVNPVKIWVKVTDDLNSNQSIYCYYGKSGESSASNGTNTFEFFDDFSQKEVGWQWTKQWETPDILDGRRSFASGDINNDGVDEIILLGGGKYYALDENNGSKLKEVDVYDPSHGFRNLKVEDINGDGYDEICFLEADEVNTAYLRVIDKDGIELWNKSFSVSPAHSMSYIAVGNLTTAPGLEIAVAKGDHIYVYDKDGNSLWDKSIDVGDIAETWKKNCIADFDGDGKNEIAVGGAYGGGENVHNIYMFNGEDGSDAWSNPITVFGDADDASYADLDDDGIADLLIVNGHKAGMSSGITALKGTDGSELWRDASYPDHCDGITVWTNPVSGDPEILLGNIKTNAKVYNKNGTVKWTTANDSELWKFEVFSGDLTGNGIPDVGWASWDDGYTPGNLQAFDIDGKLLASRAIDASCMVYYNQKIFIHDINNKVKCYKLEEAEVGVLDIDKWDISGTPSVSGEELLLEYDDRVCGKTSFGPGHAILNRAKSDKQDFNLIAFWEAIDNSNNEVEIFNSDSSSRCGDNNFDCLCWLSKKAGVNDSACIDSLLDWQNTYYNYEITWLSTEVKYLQNNSIFHTYTGAKIPIINLKPLMRVWDSSTSSILTADWVLVRKYASPEPTFSSAGGEIKNLLRFDNGSLEDKIWLHAPFPITKITLKTSKRKILLNKDIIVI